ncbi:MAG: TlpA family protein disulfide reductase [Leptospiraceae bacterium]|nr:TlpA family protein disulfide reductase [Leptospiraceae bacterium]
MFTPNYPQNKNIRVLMEHWLSVKTKKQNLGEGERVRNRSEMQFLGNKKNSSEINKKYWNKIKIFLVVLFLISLNIILSKTGDKAPKSFMLIKYGTETPKFFDEFISNKVVLLNFWKVDCVPCKEEIPELKKLLSKYKNIQIFFINFDEDSDKDRFEKFVNTFQIADRTLIDSYQTAAKLYLKSLSESETTLPVPANVLIDKDGTILYESIGYTKDKTIPELEKAIKKIK